MGLRIALWSGSKSSMQGPRSDPQHQREMERGKKERGEREKYVSLNSVCGTLFLGRQQELKQYSGMERSFRSTAFTHGQQEAVGINSGVPTRVHSAHNMV